MGGLHGDLTGPATRAQDRSMTREPTLRLGAAFWRLPVFLALVLQLLSNIPLLKRLVS